MSANFLFCCGIYSHLCLFSSNIFLLAVWIIGNYISNCTYYMIWREAIKRIRTTSSKIYQKTFLWAAIQRFSREIRQLLSSSRCWEKISYLSTTCVFFSFFKIFMVIPLIISSLKNIHKTHSLVKNKSHITTTCNHTSLSFPPVN